LPSVGVLLDKTELHDVFVFSCTTGDLEFFRFNSLVINLVPETIALQNTHANKHNSKHATHAATNDLSSFDQSPANITQINPQTATVARTDVLTEYSVARMTASL
jgi:hypothetical protein